jgi:hypothetical protein
LRLRAKAADACIVVSNYNPDAEDRLDWEIAALRKLLEPLCSLHEYRHKDFVLRFVDLEGSIHGEYSLDGLRKGNW